MFEFYPLLILIILLVVIEMRKSWSPQDVILRSHTISNMTIIIL